MERQAPFISHDHARFGIEAFHVYLLAARRQRERYDRRLDELRSDAALTECGRRVAIARIHEELHATLDQERASFEGAVSQLREQILRCEGSPALGEFDRLYNAPDLRDFRKRLFEPHADLVLPPRNHSTPVPDPSTAVGSV